MILTDELLMAAFCYRESNLWNYLDDSMIFAFRLSDGETGYCCVMGHAGEHLSLGFYRGAKGFTTYLKTITSSHLSHLDLMEISMTFDCINCDFTNLTETDGLTKEIKARIREFAKANGFKIRRQKGWPDITRHYANKFPFSIQSQQDAQDITEALHAANEVARLLTDSNNVLSLEKFGFDPLRQYPTVEGGKTVPFLVPEPDGHYRWETTQLPAFIEDEFPRTEYDNPIVTAQLKALKHVGTLAYRQFHFPQPVQDTPDEVPYYAAVLIGMDCESGDMFSPIMGNQEEMQLLNALATAFLNLKQCPKTIKVSDLQTQCLLEDFCKKNGIQLRKVKKIKEFEDFLQLMARFI